MSKTDRTRPGWVTEFFTGVLEHDHTSGECRVETLAEARGPRRSRPPCRHRLRLGYVYRAKMYGDRMTPGFEHQIYHSPMRRTARDVLHRARGEYNAGHRPGDDDIEDSWEPPLPAANNAIWLFW
ncbi:hypothetical protein KOI35_37855 [Actinoplanes bogorensis]|uniref:Uncharacterized protein n=1 Tax=Paractinoplanes bogorensis TaxID=1610840 RepID=A0ABS5Z0W3_9ACTN|nr:hypothetical protein [Actinoplanes bogorensis]MBU2669293.1 hypothetical protein [Actinoplanes bogorensis]